MSTRNVRWWVALATAPLAVAACGEDRPDATAALRAPVDGATVAGGLTVEMVADGVGIEAAGDIHAGFGHFHVIVDEGCLEEGTAVPRDPNHVHFGGGAASGTLYLAPGEHELCLQVGDGEHSALDITDTANVTVAVATLDEWCAVVAEVDAMFSATDNSGDDFAVKQVAYGNLVRLIAQLTDGLDVVDADVRDDIGAAIASASQIASAFADAPDADAAMTAIEEIFGARGADTMTEAAPWILETCDVDIDG